MQLAESLSRVLSAPQLLGQVFYRRFLEKVPEAERYFEGIDMHRQAMLVTMALTVIQQFHDHHYPAVTEFLHYLGSRHQDRRVPFDLYAKWRDTMLETLAAFHGSEWNDDISGHWRRAIDMAIDEMMNGYTEHFKL